MPRRPRSKRLWLPLLAAAAATFCMSASAQTSPYTMGLSQSLTHDSNIVRLRDGQASPAGLSKSDTVSSTALFASIDQPMGRQRVYAGATLRSIHYASNGDFDSQGHALKLGLDWQTVARISGKVSLSSDRSARTDVRDRSESSILRSNTETANQADFSLSMGLTTPLSVEAAFSKRDLRYSAPEARFREYDQTSASLGLRYRLGGATTAGVAWRQTRSDYPGLLSALPDPHDRRRRQDIDLTLAWVPTGASQLDLRISSGQTEHQRFAERDFSATSGALVWAWRPSGKLRLSTTLARDVGQDANTATTAFSRSTDTMRLRADHELTAKVSLNGSIGIGLGVDETSHPRTTVAHRRPHVHPRRTA